jgi:hypothetical protein
VNGVRRLSIFQYLRVVGAVNWWFLFVFLTFAAWIGFVRATEAKADFLPYLFLIIAPLAAGTGLLTSGRKGELDLILGAGVIRSRLWWAAFGYAWGIPSLMALAIVWLGGPLRGLTSSGTVFRLGALLLYTGGICFSAGLVEMRYFAGVVWLLLRVMLFLWPGTMVAVRQLELGASIQPHWLLPVIILELPETLLDVHMPAVCIVVCALLGLSVLLGSHFWFCRAEFEGKRS